MAGGISKLPNGPAYTPEEAEAAGIGALKAAAYASPAAPAMGAYDLGSILSAPVKDKLYRWTGGLFGELSNPVSEPLELSREAFYAKRLPAMKTVETFIKEAQDAARAVKGFDELGKNGQAARLAKAQEAGKANYAAYLESYPKLEAQADKDWQAELADRKERENEGNRKPWYQRYPGSGEVAVGLGGIGSALLARRGFGKIAEEGSSLLNTVTNARKAGNLAGEAEGLAALDSYRRALPWQYAKTGAKAALLPLELRSIGTVVDATTMPEVYNPDGSVDRRSARQQAQELLHRVTSEPEAFQQEVLPSLISGITGTAGGSFFAGKPPLSKIRAQKLYVPKSSRGQTGAITQSPDDLAQALGEKRIEMLARQRELDAARAMPPPAAPQPANSQGVGALVPTSTNSGGLGPLQPSPAAASPASGSKSSTKPKSRKAAPKAESSEPTPASPPKSASVPPEQRDAAAQELRRFLAADQLKKGVATGVLPAGGMGALMDLESGAGPVEGYAEGGSVDPALVNAVKGFEGYTPRSLWDYKQYSIGYGTRGAPGEVIDRAEAERRLSDELTKAQNLVEGFAPGAPAGVKRALASLTYNSGTDWMTAGLGQAVKRGDYDEAAQRFVQYNKAGGKTNPGLVNRRNTEVAWFDGDGGGSQRMSLGGPMPGADVPNPNVLGPNGGINVAEPAPAMAMSKPLSLPATTQAQQVDSGWKDTALGMAPSWSPLQDLGFAHGGAVDEPVHAGPLHSTVPGRTDHLPISVVAGSYVLPADIVSALGEGNTNAGMEIVETMFPPMRQTLAYAKGGKVPIAAAGGEYVLSPEQVAAIGNGDLNAGHAALDSWVQTTRANTVKTLSRLPGPAQ